MSRYSLLVFADGRWYRALRGLTYEEVLEASRDVRRFKIVEEGI